jgi:glycine cleavage system regulatory protein
MLGALRYVVNHHPFKFGCVFSCAKTSFSDWIVQSQIEKREHIDWRRNGTFAIFGFCYLGGVQYSIYVPLFSRLFPTAASYAAAPVASKLKDVAGTRNMLTQVFLDQFVHHPLMYFPAFYALKEVVNGNSASDGIKKYSKNYKEDLAALWKLWVPSTIINFTFMPMQLRIPWVASTSLIWTCIISSMRGSNDVETDVDAAMNITGGSQGAALKALYDGYGLSTKPDYLYDQSKKHLLFTAVGRDRIGFLGDFAAVAATHLGNVLDVKGYKVGREFVTIMLVETPPASEEAMVRDMERLGTKDMRVSAQPTQPWLSDSDSPRCKDGVTFTGHLRATGRDRPRVLIELTSLFAELELDVTAFSCNQHLNHSLAHDEPEQLFQMSGVVRAFKHIDRDALQQRLVAFEKAHDMRLGISETEIDTSYSTFRSTTDSTRLKRTITGKAMGSSGSS